jgi:DNA-directed RNA polymerase
MRKIMFVTVILFVFVVGCDSLRFAPNETQKQNAWLHNRTTAMTAELAEDEFTSAKLQSLANLSELQSRAFVTYCGLPKEFPPAQTAEDLLSDSSLAITQTAISDSSERPDVWELTDAGLELAIAISALIGGVYGTKAVAYLKEARAKTKALKEIIEGNELFKKLNADSTEAFKEAQKNQSAETKQIVTQLK